MAENINGIIGAIAEKASADADKIIALAEQYAAAKIADAEREAERIRAAAAAEAASRCAFIAERSESNARIERKKAIAGAKTDITDEVFAKVCKRLESMDDNRAADLFAALIAKYGESGDIALIAQRYAAVAKRIADNPAVKAKGIAVKTESSLPAGMLLSGKKSDKDFTFRSLARFYKAEVGTDVAKKLFEDGGGQV